MPTPSTASDISPVLQDGPWLLRTNIVTVLKGHTTVLASLSLQSKPIRNLFDNAIKIGKLEMITGSQYCTVSSDSLKSIADATLNSACEFLGFTQTNAIRDHLQDGDYNTYARVLMSYVAHRIGLERKEMKNTQAATVLTSFGFGNTTEHHKEAQHLLLNYTYHYATLPSGKHDNSKPFEHPVMSQYMGAMFFGNTIYSKLLALNKQVFVSSIPEKPDELELPPGLVASSVASIHAILQDYSRSCNEHFPSKELAGVWKTALAILNNIRKVKRLRYHVLMHKLYIDASIHELRKLATLHHGAVTRKKQKITTDTWPEILSWDDKMSIMQECYDAASNTSIRRNECSFCGGLQAAHEMSIIPCSELDISLLKAAVQELPEKTSQPAIQCFRPETIENDQYCLCSYCKHEIRYANGMWTGNLPEELRGLTFLEEQCIARARATKCMFELELGPTDPSPLARLHPGNEMGWDFCLKDITVAVSPSKSVQKRRDVFLDDDDNEDHVRRARNRYP
ncbi:hypothetical protein K435DRAFT_809860 [Dendrothele bispora CBS 962.96]|uniref:Uncharacterized protein n=1 Tax=Dendrothele bispora (strain CBS 962.96) TaxID=1314807 RepID=A0A4S8KWV0_DENBC|nr:hypothetical protein K435DRAFT_809860 [Dendrothele bispora CBS 962.96]